MRKIQTEQDKAPEAPQPPNEQKQEPVVQLVTEQQLLLHNLQAIAEQQAQTIQLLLKGFEKLGVKNMAGTEQKDSEQTG
ncbi:MAG: hypothetical protein QME12_08690 [Nanoarchaeota archaeon]|nr:hypothetical protein [Nanoarchaeota archaeon]